MSIEQLKEFIVNGSDSIQKIKDKQDKPTKPQTRKAAKAELPGKAQQLTATLIQLNGKVALARTQLLKMEAESASKDLHEEFTPDGESTKIEF
ncbi:hypothetical protein BDP27DRAFT_1439514 [Rhodocollybia butyracea]|uniref:Uncharacterized protein n=1 Tax=Rhodocollybia butyracea TaxID=206335 RepID=A0A9P5TWG0_9AGAR|nr:hypothetical protein BDP27DRAFT_1439514 [Rhodocollybia butyracea]